LLSSWKRSDCIVSTCEDVVSLPHASGAWRRKLDSAAKEWGVALVGTGVKSRLRDGQAVVTLAAVSHASNTPSAARGGCSSGVCAQKKIGAGMTLKNSCAGKSGRHQARRFTGIVAMWGTA